MSDTLFDRLFSRAIVCNNGCWEYSGYRNDGGYGIISVLGNPQKAHRVAYDLCVGDVPNDMKVLHSCDNPPCVNPAHLFLGTQQDNVDDMIGKGRLVLGKRILIPEQVIEIRRLLTENTLNAEEISKLFGVNRNVIYQIKHRHTWRHI
jgi:hypothetical protein